MSYQTKRQFVTKIRSAILVEANRCARNDLPPVRKSLDEDNLGEQIFKLWKGDEVKHPIFSLWWDFESVKTKQRYEIKSTIVNSNLKTVKDGKNWLKPTTGVKTNCKIHTSPNQLQSLKNNATRGYNNGYIYYIEIAIQHKSPQPFFYKIWQIKPNNIWLPDFPKGKGASYFKGTNIVFRDELSVLSKQEFRKQLEKKIAHDKQLDKEHDALIDSYEAFRKEKGLIEVPYGETPYRNLKRRKT